jgi:sulfur relay (sulfurtransferase) complex TusBCD TusD component (DsrE family)
MHKIALVIYGKLEGSDNSAIYRALMFAQELRRAGDDVSIVFDGAGSVAASELVQPGHQFNTLFHEVRPQVRGVCRHCAKAYGVLAAIEAAGLPLLGDDRGHASLRALLEEGRQIITI